ncbi:MAG: dicarboxylate/amino acid:cation symporter [Spongiibacteraceae bacterium]|jgi:Na+/H+-dicarboxylate symporter|nr:dicarboxylate/amino acid:cation symporter [Spongiibacteraceae bacterium]
MIRLALHWQIAIAIVFAVGAGLLTGTDGSIGPLRFYVAYEFVGTLFLNALKMLIVPLIMSSIIVGIATFSRGENLGRVGTKIILYFLGSTLLAVLLGLVIVNLLEPGIANGEPAGGRLNLTMNDPGVQETLAHVASHSGRDFLSIFYDLIPVNVVAAAVEGQMLGLITFSLLFGFFMSRVAEGPARVLHDFWQGVFETMMAITELVMKFAPLGVFGLVARTVAATGFEAFSPLLVFFIAVVLGLAIHSLVVLPLLMRVFGRVRPYMHIKLMTPALLTAFSTASSSATLPVTIERMEKHVGVSNRISGFVLPLGATINMNGTALYECAAAMFIAQAYGLDLTFGQQFLIVITAVLTSIGVAGIPAASLVAIGVILGVIGLPLEGIGMLLVTDRILDMMRTAVNVFSDTCGAAIIAHSEGEQTNISR